MTPVQAAMMAASLTVVFLLLFVIAAYCLWQAWKLFSKISNDLGKIAVDLKEMQVEFKGTIVVCRSINAELGYLRALMTPGYQQAVIEPPTEDGGPATPPEPTLQRPEPNYPQYPLPVFERFPVVTPEPAPDAKMDDTDRNLLAQTDADLANAELVEDLRSRGIHIEDDSEQHPGVEVESK